MDFRTVRDEILANGLRRLAHFTALIELGDEQNCILIQGRHDELAANIGEFDPLLVEMQKMDRYDESLFRKLWEMKPGLSHEGLNDLSDERKAIDRQVEAAAMRLKDITTVNAQLLSAAMKFVNFTMIAISRTASSTCGAGGGSLSVVLDTRV